MFIEIKSIFENKTLFSGDYENISEFIIKLAREGANLRSANLRGANLCDANLDKKLKYISISPIGSRGAQLWTMQNESGEIIYNTGCFSGNKKAFIDKINTTYGNNSHAKQYLKAIELIECVLE